MTILETNAGILRFAQDDNSKNKYRGPSLRAPRFAQDDGLQTRAKAKTRAEADSSAALRNDKRWWWGGLRPTHDDEAVMDGVPGDWWRQPTQAELGWGTRRSTSHPSGAWMGHPASLHPTQAELGWGTRDEWAGNEFLLFPRQAIRLPDMGHPILGQKDAGARGEVAPAG